MTLVSCIFSKSTSSYSIPVTTTPLHFFRTLLSTEARIDLILFDFLSWEFLGFRRLGIRWMKPAVCSWPDSRSLPWLSSPVAVDLERIFRDLHLLSEKMVMHWELPNCLTGWDLCDMAETLDLEIWPFPCIHSLLMFLITILFWNTNE